jgi:HPt (histidine-containing phosphotransfer) domain-containing protein
MQELDSQRLEEFGFTDSQIKELLGQFQSKLQTDFKQLRSLCQSQQQGEFISKLHAFKGMVSLFAKPSLVGDVVSIEMEAHAHQHLDVSDVRQQMLALGTRVERLHMELQSYLDSME